MKNLFLIFYNKEYKETFNFFKYTNKIHNEKNYDKWQESSS